MKHLFEHYRCWRQARQDAKEARLARKVVESKWFQEYRNNLKGELYQTSFEQIRPAVDHLSASAEAFNASTVEMRMRYDNLAREMQKIRKFSGDALTATGSISEVVQGFNELCRKHDALDAKLKSQHESMVALLETIAKYKETDQYSRKALAAQQASLQKTVSDLSRKKEAVNEIAIGGIKLKDLHNGDDIARAVVAMDKKVSQIAEQVSAVYNVNRGAGRLSAVKRVKPSGEEVVK